MLNQSINLPPDTRERFPPNPSQKGWYSIKAELTWVDREMVYPPTDGHPSKC